MLLRITARERYVGIKKIMQIAFLDFISFNFFGLLRSVIYLLSTLNWV